MDFALGIDVDAPPDVVWGVMSDVERWPEWTASIRSVRRLDPGPLAVGRRVRIRQPRFPPAVWTVTELEEGRSFTWEAGGPGVRVSARHTVGPRGGGSRVALSLGFHGLLGPLFGRLTAGVNARYVRMEAKGLKRRSEEVAGAAPEE